MQQQNADTNIRRVVYNLNHLIKFRHIKQQQKTFMTALSNVFRPIMLALL